MHSISKMGTKYSKVAERGPKCKDAPRRGYLYLGSILILGEKVTLNINVGGKRRKNTILLNVWLNGLLDGFFFR